MNSYFAGQIDDVKVRASLINLKGDIINFPNVSKQRNFKVHPNEYEQLIWLIPIVTL